jgi:hypothetical protein
VEADLTRYYQVDIRDRWRYDEHDRPLLTLRRLSVLIRHLPDDSATAVAINGEPGWTRGEVLLADLWSAFTGKEHPALGRARKSSKAKSASWITRIATARARLARRRHRIESGEIT